MLGDFQTIGLPAQSYPSRTFNTGRGIPIWFCYTNKTKVLLKSIAEVAMTSNWMPNKMPNERLNNLHGTKHGTRYLSCAEMQKFLSEGIGTLGFTSPLIKLYARDIFVCTSSVWRKKKKKGLFKNLRSDLFLKASCILWIMPLHRFLLTIALNYYEWLIKNMRG